MIPAKKDIEIQGTLDGQAVEMSIDQNALHHIMQVLTDLYSDTEMAVVREYSTNAYDAHVEAGNPMPIEVYTPTQLSPFLRIKDQGVGLDAQGIVDVYSKYGLTTKDATNDQTGCLGLGCKSALTYTNQFTVIGIQGGVKTTIAVSRDEDGVGTMTIVDESETEECNGVEIVIPVKANNTFEKRAAFLFRFWLEGMVLLNGEEPEHFTDGIKVSDDIEIVKDYSNLSGYPMGDYVVMGNVPYPIKSDQCDIGLPSRYALIAKVPMGALHFSPDREELQYTKTTKDYLAKLTEDVKAGLAKAINQEMEAASSMPQALTVALKWRSVLGNAAASASLKYRNTAIPQNIVAPNHDDGGHFIGARGEKETDYYGKNIKVGKNFKVPAVDLSSLSTSLWVYGFNRSFTPSCKKKLWHYCDTHNIEYPELFIMCEAKPQSPWIDPETFIPWSEVEPLKVPRVNDQGRTLISDRIPGSYDIYMCSDGQSTRIEDVPGDDIDTSMPVYYCVGDYHTASRINKRLKRLMDDYTLVYFRANREAKFTRLFPSAQKYTVALDEAFGFWMEYLSEREKEILGYLICGRRSSSCYALQMLPLTGIKDPRLAHARSFEDIDPHYVQYLENHWATFEGYVQCPFTWHDPFDDYPLIDQYEWRTGMRRKGKYRKHAIMYLNAAYEAGLD